MVDDEINFNMEKYAPAFEGILTEEELTAALNVEYVGELYEQGSTFLLQAWEVEHIAKKILELEEIVRQNALVAEME